MAGLCKQPRRGFFEERLLSQGAFRSLVRRCVNVLLQQVASEFTFHFGRQSFTGRSKPLELFSVFEANPELSTSSNLFSAPVSS
jgi:hypothetical protein